jgi:hypothetical protein
VINFQLATHSHQNLSRNLDASQMDKTTRNKNGFSKYKKMPHIRCEASEREVKTLYSINRVTQLLQGAFDNAGLTGDKNVLYLLVNVFIIKPVKYFDHSCYQYFIAVIQSIDK